MASGLIVVQQYQRMVVQRLGTFVGTRRPGLHFLIPVLYNGTKVDLRERVTRVPTQKYITWDNVVVDMDFVIQGLFIFRNGVENRGNAGEVR
jgi:regulator of protease activity HflC (stomatin/prohibitin superfamily)